MSQIAIPTADRPELLERLVFDLIQAGAAEIDGLELLIVDDSRTPTAVEQNRRIIENSGIRNFVLDRCARAILAARLSGERGLENRLVCQMLVGSDDLPTYGAAQNAIHLFSKSTGVLVLDDDIRADRVVKRLIPGRLAPTEHPECCWFYRDASELPDGESLSLEHLLQELTDSLMVGSNFEPTKVAVFGLAGDPGASSSANLIAPLNSVTLRNSQLSDEHYRIARHTRCIIKVAPYHCIRSPGPMMTAAYGLRNDLPALPFFPELRGSDAVFGLSTGIAFPSYRFQYLPIALHHTPPARYGFTEDLATLRFSTVVGSIMTALLPEAQGSPVALCRRMSDFVDCTPAEFQRRVNEISMLHYVATLEQLEFQLASGHAGHSKALDIVEQANKVIAKIARGQFIVADLPGDAGAQSRKIKQSLQDWLEASTVWPELRTWGAEIGRELSGVDALS